MADNKKPKIEQRGGRRPGAGRKPNFLKKLGLKPVAAAALLAKVDEEKFVTALLHDKSPDVRLRTWTTLREMAYGKPKQAVQLGGGLGVAHFGNPDGTPISDAELESKLREIEEQLGMTKTIDADPPKELPAGPASQKLVESLQALVSGPPKPPENPATAPQPYQSVTASFPVPDQQGTTVYCDQHGSFIQKHPGQNCPNCQAQWNADNKADERRLSNLLPGEPAWNRGR